MKLVISFALVLVYFAIGTGLTYVFDMDFPTIITFLTLGVVCTLLAENITKGRD